jgi:hypothetical protein
LDFPFAASAPKGCDTAATPAAALLTSRNRRREIMKPPTS